jgi:hypothetical protein
MSNRMSAKAMGALLLSLMAATPGFAQAPPRPDRPYRGLFASGQRDSEQSLIAQGSVGGGYDSNVLLDAGFNTDPRFAESGMVGAVSGSLAYTMSRDRVSFGASFGESSRYYPQNSDTFIHSYSETVGINYRPTTRTTLAAAQFIAYQPFMLYSLFPPLYDAQPGQLNLPPVDLATGFRSYMSYGGNVGIDQRLSRRITFTASVNAQHSDTPYVNGSLSQQGGNVGLRFGLTRNLGLRVGYGRQQGEYAGLVGKVVTETYDVGIDFQKALSISRRTMLSFSTGTGAFENTQDGSGNRSYYVTGSARLNHEIGRSWMASAAYDRSVQFIDALLLPSLTDSFSAGVNGFISRRVEFSSGVQGSIGKVGFGDQRDNQGAFDTYQGFANLAYALSRWANVNVSYSYYQYRFDTITLLPTGVARNFDRQSVRANLNLWAPLMNKARRK